MHGQYTLFNEGLEVVTAGRLVYGVDMARILDDLDDILELWGRIAREPGKGCLLPEEGNQIRLYI